jgi:predicted aspartyl protease
MAIKKTIFGAIKLISFAGSALIAAILITSSASSRLNIKKTLDIDQVTIASVPLQYSNFSDLGNVASPYIDTQIITASNKSIKTKFLIDTGAKISALPMEYADKIGIDKNTAKRIYLRSATNNTTYGYIADVNIKINETTLTIPVAFAEVIEPLLGTFGFLDNYSLEFDRGESIIIKAKSNS